MKLSEPAETAFESVLRPALLQLGFEQIKLKDCIRPEFLFRNGRVWFSLSWDWRDRYLEVALGHLFWFKDVMPRVVVIGDFSHWNPSVTWDAIRSESDFPNVFGKIRDSLPEALSKTESEYPGILSAFRQSRNAHVKINDYIGDEVGIDSLQKFRA